MDLIKIKIVYWYVVKFKKLKNLDEWIKLKYLIIRIWDIALKDI